MAYGIKRTCGVAGQARPGNAGLLRRVLAGFLLARLQRAAVALERVTVALVIMALPLGMLSACAALAEDAPLIAAASDLQFALNEVAERFTAETGQPVRLTFGSSGNFARQIEQGAPFELYLSADEEFVFRLADGGHARDRGVLYAVGRIVLFAPHASPLNAGEGLAGVRAALGAGSISRFAIANPEHAPYGRAAEQALRRFELWERLLPHIVLGENVSQAAQFAASGNTQGGIFAYSLALAPSVRERGRFALIPEDAHEPLRQRMVLTRRATPAAERFYDYMQAEPARGIMRRYGFALPGE